MRSYIHSTETSTVIESIHDIITHCLTILKHDWNDNIAIVQNFTRESTQLMGNEGRLHQAILNILTNAILALPNGGNIFITTERLKRKVRLTFADDGPGIQKDHHKTVFEPFFTTRDPGEGTGLGLAITYSIILEHGGDIKVGNRHGGGAEFVITLPIA